jgi:2-polyprenyl-6-methoxyphenol hydroxylase-like FAD-dependent oxidoreductase
MEDHGFYKEQEWIDEKMIKSVTNLSHLGIYQQPHVSNWFRGNVILIGDAAHATSPFMGQGANQAMIDGYYLGRCLQDCKDIPSGAGLTFKFLMDKSC